MRSVVFLKKSGGLRVAQPPPRGGLGGNGAPSISFQMIRTKKKFP